MPTTLCRWCGSHLNSGFKLCPICHKNQSRFHHVFGEGSNLIGLIAAVITFAQLMVAIEQNNSAVAAAEISEQAKISTEDAAEKIQKLENKFMKIELDTRQAASEIRQTTLNIQALKANDNKPAVVAAQKELSQTKQEYDQLQAQLKTISPTQTIASTVTGTKKECINLGFTKTCTNVPDVRQVTKKIANPGYRALQLELESKQAQIQAKEAGLGAAINP